MLPKNRPPSTPGEILEEEFLVPLEMTQKQLALKMDWDPSHLNLLIRGKRGVTAQTALKLARVFKTTPEFWMSLQSNCDLWEALHKEKKRAAR
jgi:addiction module HigA family antidote